MAYVINLAGVDLTKTDSTPRYDLGLTVITDDGHYQYVKHSLAAATAGNAYKIDENFSTVALDSTESGTEPTNVGVFQIGVAAGTTTAQYAFAFIGFGNFEASVATGLSAGTALTTTASAGVLGTGGDAVGAALVDSTSGGAAVVTCYAPSKLATNV